MAHTDEDLDALWDALMERNQRRIRAAMRLAWDAKMASYDAATAQDDAEANVAAEKRRATLS